MNLIHNLIALTGWFSNTDPTPQYPNGQQAQENPDAMDSIAEKVRKELVCCGYNPEVENLRETEYTHVKDVTYLDHAGTTLYATSLIRSVSDDLVSNLYGNPHSQSPSSQLTTKKIDDIRLRVLQLFNANPEDYDIIFCANATAGMKLVLEAFTAQSQTFSYRYHKDCHTSAVGMREVSGDARCFLSDQDVENWLGTEVTGEDLLLQRSQGLFVYPAQSNFSGRRLPLSWPKKLRASGQKFYTLLDAAALVTTSPLDLCLVEPDFTVVSFYKMFGYPDLGGLIIRKASPGLPRFLQNRSYFGGGTVATVIAQDETFHAKRNEVPHEHMEDGTIPFHSIIALDHAITVHSTLYGSFNAIAAHTTSLLMYLHQRLASLKHYNTKPVCILYSGCPAVTDKGLTGGGFQGPTIAFNLRRASGGWVGYSEVEKLAAVKGIHIRTGGLCNPGGVESYIGLKAWEIKQNYEAGHRCWDDRDVMHGKPTGAIRVSLGAMSTLEDVLKFSAFIEEFYVDRREPSMKQQPVRGAWGGKATAVVESITVYPIKSCGGYRVPAGIQWELKPHGLAWDREWCLVHLGTGSAMDQKQYNRLALVRPLIDLDNGILSVTFVGTAKALSVSLASSELETLQTLSSHVCGDKINAFKYTAPEVIEFFSTAIGVPCTLARFPVSPSSKRHFKQHLATPRDGGAKICTARLPPILLSNESPILLVNRTSVNHLNEEIKNSGGKPAKADVFRANIVISETGFTRMAYAEDTWKHLQIGKEYMRLLGPCRRCHMVCIDQQTAMRGEEPYLTLSKTRRIDGRVLFGQHAMHLPQKSKIGTPGIKVGDLVRVLDSEPSNKEFEEP